MICENSPKLRKAWATRITDSRQHRIAAVMFRRPPFVAVRALVRSYGYKILGAEHGAGSQQAKWSMAIFTDWVPFEVENREGTHCTRWVRSVPGVGFQFSDGAKVPRALVVKYALKRHEYSR